MPALSLRNRILGLLIGVSIAASAGYIVYAKSHPPRPDGGIVNEILPVMPAQVISGSADIKGNPDAEYTLVEFGDYQCPPCKANYPVVESLLSRHKNLRFQFRQLPLTRLHEKAMAASLLAQDARSRGRFWQVHHALYSLKTEIDDSQMKAIAAQFHLPLKRDAKTKAVLSGAVEQDVATAQKIGVRGTPSFVLCCPNGNVVYLAGLAEIDKYL